MKKLLTLLIGLVWISMTVVIAQTKTISGKITDATGNPAPGITVMIKGTTTGVSSDLAGSYTLKNVPENGILVFSCIGMLSQEHSATEGVTINATMKDDVFELEGVVVVGYGTSKVKDLTSPIISIKASEIAKHATPNPLQALQGKVAGVQITNFGEPGSSPSVRIRGIGSFTSENPLYVVDGMFYENIGFLNNNDIEGITVLKDASAAAIYGVRASNGVILITTKKGKFNQKPVVTYDGYLGIQKATNLLKMANSEQYTTMMSERNELDIINTSISLWGGQGGIPTTNTDWYKEILRDAIIHNQSLDVSGGSEKTAYTIGLNYLNQDGIMDAKSDYSRFNVRTKGDFKPYDWLNVGVNLILSKSGSNSASGAAWARAYYAPSIIPVFDESNPNTYPQKFTDFDKLGLNNGIYANPVAVAYYGESQANAIQLLPSYYAEINFIKNNKLVFRTSFNQDITFSDGLNYTPQFYVSSVHNALKSALTKSTSQYKSYIFDNTLTYTDNFGNHNVMVMAGSSTRNENYRSWWGYGENVSDAKDEYMYLSQADVESLTTGDGGYAYRGASFFGRTTYNYADKYLLSLTLRADGTSKYQEKWGYFPSFGAGWVISEESFMKNQNLLNYLKIRASYGKLGNDKVAASNGFPTTVFGINYSGVFGGVLYPGFRIDENFSWLSWETVTETNIGFESATLNDRLKLDVDYFHRMTRDAVIATPVPTSTAYVSGNWGQILNQGVEVTLNWSDHIGSAFNYHAGLNLSTLHNEVKKLKYGVPYLLGGSAQFRSITRPGESMYSYYGYKVIGVYQNQEQIDNDPIAVASGLQPGDLMFENINNDDAIDDQDRQILGSPLPTFTYGGNFDMTYRNIDLSFTIMGVTGNEIINQKRGSRGVADKMNYEANVVENRWHGEGTSNSSPSAIGLNRSWNYATLNSYFVESGSFFRIQNVQMGYSFNNIKNGPKIRVYVSADRPWTLFKYHGFTPEVSSGYDGQTYPLAATYNFGLRISY